MVRGVRVLDDPSGASGFWGGPFPDDRRLGADGTVSLDGFPNPDDVDFVSRLVALIDGRAQGFGTTSGIFVPLSGAVDASTLPDLEASLGDDASVYLQAPDGSRVPVLVHFEEDGGPFGTDDLLSLLPLQGIPLEPESTYRVVVTERVLDTQGRPLVPHADDTTDAADFSFTTWSPTQDMATAVAAARTEPLPVPLDAWALTETFDEFCVYENRVDVPVYQTGEPPFTSEGGTWELDGAGVPVLQGSETARILVTIPRASTGSEGWPTAVFIRTGGGGDRPLVERGVRDASGAPVEPGSGPARNLAAAGYAGVSVDGPHGGLRNITNADEQFLMFNVANPGAMRDNVRQSALELALLPDVIDAITIDTSGCPGAPASSGFDTADMALFGHSMGATIAPLVIANEPAYGALVLSGAGGSWIHNITYKQKPLEVRPLAETMLKFGDYGRTLHDHEPILSLLQFGGELADPPVYAKHTRETRMVDVLMHQGMVDRYILPPIANSTSLAYGLDLAGPSLDAQTDEVAHFTPLHDLLPLVGRSTVPYPVGGNAGEHTAVVVQHAEDGVEDGHEVMFQLQAPKMQYRCFLQSRDSGAAAVVPEGAGEWEDCGI